MAPFLYWDSFEDSVKTSSCRHILFWHLDMMLFPSQNFGTCGIFNNHDNTIQLEPASILERQVSHINYGILANLMFVSKRCIVLGPVSVLKRHVSHANPRFWLISC